MKYHILILTVTMQNFVDFAGIWELDGVQLDTIGDNREVWEITCNDEHEYAIMQDCAEAWEQYGNSWEQLETPWNSEESGARV